MPISHRQTMGDYEIIDLLDPSSRFQTAEEFRRSVDQLRGVPQPASEPAVASARAAEPPALVAQAALAGAFAGETAAPRWSSWSLVAAGLLMFLLVVLMFIAVVRHT